MNDKDMRLFLAEAIYKSEFDFESKKMLLEYVKKANTHQLMTLIMDAKITRATEKNKKIIEERFAASNFPTIIEATKAVRKTMFSIMGTSIGPFWNAYRAIRAKFDECTPKCGTHQLNTVRRQFCMLKCKKGIIQQEISLIQSNISKCKDEKTKAKLVKMLATAKANFAKADACIKKYQSKEKVD
jgi:hypothetical protein